MWTHIDFFDFINQSIEKFQTKQTKISATEKKSWVKLRTKKKTMKINNNTQTKTEKKKTRLFFWVEIKPQFQGWAYVERVSRNQRHQIEKRPPSPTQTAPKYRSQLWHHPSEHPFWCWNHQLHSFPLPWKDKTQKLTQTKQLKKP